MSQRSTRTKQRTTEITRRETYRRWTVTLISTQTKSTRVTSILTKMRTTRETKRTEMRMGKEIKRRVKAARTLTVTKMRM